MKVSTRMTKLVWAMLLALTFVFSAPAQTSRAQIQGLVTDSSGATVPNATVTLSNVKTGVTVVRKTSDTGLYVFDLVDAGTYTVDVVAVGFPKFTQPNIQVESGGDVTINAVLNVGALQQSVTVNETAEAIEFNTANDDLTIDTKMANDTPRLDRNPFKLTLIEPQAVNTRGEVQPYNSWSANSVDLGGGTNLKNELELDGIPLGIGQKVAYVPNTDDVQESIIAINSVEAESGHSAGGTIDVTTKSGSNEWHGMAFYLGRYPWLSAIQDRTRDNINSTRQNMYGGTFSNPILKNKLFNYFSIEDWHVSQPGSLVLTVPTALERTGDFSQSLNADGTLRVIYNPYSTVVNPVTGAVTRQAFAGNKIPASMMDPATVALMNDFWAPNHAPSDLSGQNNYEAGQPNLFAYYNFLDRMDYVISDKLRLSGHFARYNTNNTGGNPTPNKSFLIQPTGSIRGGNQAAADLVYTLNPTTVVDVNGDWHNFSDSYTAPDLGKGGYAKVWPTSTWYTPYATATNNLPVFEPNLQIGGTNVGGPGFYWYQQPSAGSFSTTIAHQHGSHYLKAGFSWRREGGLTYVNSADSFNFPASLTASTFNNPPGTQGDGFATFLLGALDGSSAVYGGPAPTPQSNWYGMFIQDDWKISPKITINWGLRDEYETAISDPNHLLSQGLNLSVPIPEFQANPPQMPAEALALVGGAGFYKYNGAWSFTSASHPGQWNAQKVSLAPRFGIAYRLNDKTVLRFGYARYVQPIAMDFAHAPLSGFEDINILEPPFYGQSANQNTLGLNNGIPQQTFSNPFPANVNPLVPIQGKAGGAATARGSTAGVLWYAPNSGQPYNDRFNLTAEHEFPDDITVSATYFLNLGDQQYNKELNGINPQLAQQLGATALDNTVANPFYHYQNNPAILPGNLYNQQTVQLQQLLVPYPQYGPLFEIGVLGARERYNSATFNLQKRFSKGYNFVVTYAYIREQLQNWDNAVDEYNNVLKYQDADTPRHRFNIAFTYELPFGKGRTFLPNSNRAVDAVLGGWQITALSTFNSGDFPRFNNLNSGATPNQDVVVTGSVCVNNPTPQHYFNTSAVKLASDAANIVQYNIEQSCFTGPSFWNVDASLIKSFNITERVHSQLKISAYNAFNRLNRGDPNLDPNNLGQFGTALYQGAPGGTYGAQGATPTNNTGRQMELGLRIFF